MSPFDPTLSTLQEMTEMASVADQSTLQHTLAAAVQCTGVGVHSGEKVTMRLLPAPADHGIVFLRTDLRNGARKIPARWDYVVDTRMCTVIGNDHGGKVATIEHLMAALAASGIDNALIEIDGPEVPVMDGSAAPFLFLIEMAGLEAQTSPRREIVVMKPVSVEHNNARVTLEPDESSRLSFEIAFASDAIRTQHYDFPLTKVGFKSEIGRARTFGFFEEVEALQKMGLGRGGSLDNAIIIKDNKVLNEDGLRYPDEFVRHKLLDAVGDLALAGGPIRGRFHGHCSGHALNNKLLHALFADSSAYCIAE